MRSFTFREVDSSLPRHIGLRLNNKKKYTYIYISGTSARFISEERHKSGMRAVCKTVVERAQEGPPIHPHTYAHTHTHRLIYLRLDHGTFIMRLRSRSFEVFVRWSFAQTRRLFNPLLRSRFTTVPRNFRTKLDLCVQESGSVCTLANLVCRLISEHTLIFHRRIDTLKNVGREIGGTSTSLTHSYNDLVVPLRNLGEGYCVSRFV